MNAASQLKLKVEAMDDCVIAAPIGRIDAITSPALLQDIERILANGTTRLVIDTSAVPFVSSAGLRVFIHAAKFLMADGRFVVCGLNSNVSQVFLLAGFDRIMTLTDTRSNAIEKVNE